MAAPPDVCKVPTPAGPVPTPFVNTAQDSMLTKGSKSVTIDGHPVALTSSEISTSSGDEPGTAGGLISSKFKGKLTWGGGSVDVKIEGKGVVRFLDPTLHNGNTFNTSFISAGGTGLAYGDDTECTACGKSVENHRVLETPEAVAHVEMVFVELMKRFHEQRPLIEKYLQLREERNAVQNKSIEEAGDASRALATKIQRREELLLQLKSKHAENKAAIKDELAPLQTELKAAEQKIKDKRAEGIKAVQALQQEMDALNEQLKRMKPVLRRDERFNTFVEGYMVGVCICKCPDSPKMLAVCSGDTPPGFQEAVAATPFKHVEGFQVSERQLERLEDMKRKRWDCAAPKLLQAGGAGGHKISTMSERYFSPMLNVTVGVEYRYTDDKGTRPENGRFGHGESVPSCDACQKLVPEMLCDNHKECA
ncbi:DUF4150 domain-containing protein [Vitiosangium sp. GDMCC 1.1324]|uniref:DUF4150 domain-containing protein n=1 Tax=Vitiosangium sp. (strain GDMCC 1.1324) TaxID=2138576 RepID=UPI0027121593|nr:PAAR-like domain-containing protein [Vitiosangium sp. GDMCC 1.1324]